MRTGIIYSEFMAEGNYVRYQNSRLQKNLVPSVQEPSKSVQKHKVPSVRHHTKCKSTSRRLTP